MGEINKSEDIINILFDYVKENFDKFGHKEPNWWWHTDYGGSWSPFVQDCFIREGDKHKEYKVFFCVQDSTQLKKYMGTSYRHPDCNKSDIDLFDIKTNEFVLSLEHSEDGTTITTQKDKIIQEIKKLKKIPSGFKVLISRPQPFNRRTNPIGYSQSIPFLKQKIQNQLKDDNGKWLIILIAPQPDNEPTEIIFYCYELKGNILADLDERHIQIKKDIKKWIINEP